MELKTVIKGNPIRREKLRVDGKATLVNVYKVDIETLYYNDQNGRIATFMAEHKANSHININDMTFEDYNNLIMGFIKKSGNEDKYKTTKADIKQNGQMKTGIILEDGRIIDGNRRFTCLRELYMETHKEEYKYFECFVLPLPKNTRDEIIIKSLELAYQFGEDQKEDYNPIDKLVDIYHCLIDPKLFTPEEYRQKVNNQMKLADIKLAMEKAQLMVDYLEYIGQPHRYDLARNLKLDGPIQEIAVLKKQIKSKDEWEKIEPVFFTTMEAQDKGDRTREIRSLKKVLENQPKQFEDLKKHTEKIEILKKEMNQLGEHDYVERAEVQGKISSAQTDLKNDLKSKNDETGKDIAQRKQNEIVKSVHKKLLEMDLSSLSLLPDELKLELEDEVKEIELFMQRIKRAMK